MSNKLPKCFSTIKPKIPVITEHYEIRNPVFNLPTIKHKFAYLTFLLLTVFLKVV